MRRFLTKNLIKLLVLGIFLNLVYILYLAFYPFKGVEIKSSVPVLNSPVKRGTIMVYRVSYCRYTDAPDHFTQTLRGPTLITLAQSSGKGEPGCRSVKVDSLIPSYAEPGNYYLEVNNCYQLSVLQNKCVNFRTKEFEVIE